MANKLYFVEDTRKYFVFVEDGDNIPIQLARDIDENVRYDHTIVLIDSEAALKEYAKIADWAIEDDMPWCTRSAGDPTLEQAFELSQKAIAEEAERSRVIELGDRVRAPFAIDDGSDDRLATVVFIDRERDEYTLVDANNSSRVTQVARAAIRFLSPGFKPGVHVLFKGLEGRVLDCIGYVARVRWNGNTVPEDLRVTYHPYEDLLLAR